MHGFALILAAATIWGVGQVLSEVALATADPWTTSLVRSLAFFPVVAAYVLRRTRVTWTADRAALYGTMAGVAIATSIVSSRLALSVYEVSLVSPFREFSSVVTLLVAIPLLDESVTPRKLLGIAAAIGAVYLLSP